MDRVGGEHDGMVGATRHLEVHTESTVSKVVLGTIRHLNGLARCGEADRGGGASERRQGGTAALRRQDGTAAPGRPKACAKAKRAALRERTPASDHDGWPALPPSGQRAWGLEPNA